MELKPGYKMTEVGVIPEDWEVSTLGDGLSSKPSYGVNAPACAYKKGFTAYIRITDITDDGKYIPSSYVNINSNNFYLKNGDIVLARTGASVGKSYKYKESDGQLVYAGFLICIHPNNIIFDPSYVFYYLHTDSYWKWVSLTSMRSGQPGINSQEYISMLLPRPSIPEQQAIAAALSDVDELLSSLDRLIDKKKDIRLATMQELLTGKKRLPGFNEAWKSIQINQLGYYKSGNVFPISCQISSLYPNTIPFFKVSDLNNHIKYLINSKNSITIENAKNIHATIIPSKSIIFAKIGAAIFLERKRILKQNSYIDNNMCAFICKNNISYEFIYYKFINTSLSNLVSTTALPALGTKELNSIIFFMPSSLAEQQAIASVLSDMDAEIEALEARRDKVRNIKTGMMQELLTGKTRLISTGETA